MSLFNDKIGGVSPLEFVRTTDELLGATQKSKQLQTDSRNELTNDLTTNVLDENQDPQNKSPEDAHLKKEFEIYCQFKLSLIDEGIVKNESKEQFLQKKEQFLEKITSKKFLLFGEENERWDTGKYRRNIDKMFPDYHQILDQKVKLSQSNIKSKTESLIANLDTTLTKLIELLQAVEKDQIGVEALKKDVAESLKKSEKSLESAISTLDEWAKDEKSGYEKKYKDVISKFEQTIINITINIEGIQEDKVKIQEIIHRLNDQKEKLVALNQVAQNTTEVLQLVEIENIELNSLTENISTTVSESESVYRSTEPVSVDAIKTETQKSTATVEKYDDEVELLEFKKRAEKGTYGKSIEDQNTYYISEKDALIRENSNPNKITTKKIPQGVEVKRLKYHRFEKEKEVWEVEVVETNKNTGVSKGDKLWTSASNATVSKTISDSDTFISFYDDVKSVDIYESPYGIKAKETKDKKEITKTKNIKDIEFKITDQCGSFVKIKQGELSVGWIKKVYLASKEKQDNLKAYKEWLEARYTEISAIEDNAKKVSRIEGILGQVEEVCYNINKKDEYPDLTSLDKEPKFNNQDGKNTFVPPGLIAQVRKFIELLEKDKTDSNTEEAEIEECVEVIEETTESEERTDTVNENEAITVTPVIDWNARIGAQQYRTQSDNLTPPEVTCGVTAFSMAMERIGYSREDVLAAIDRKITKEVGSNLTDAQFQEKWEEKAEEFLKQLKDTDEFQKLRGGSDGGKLVGQEKELSQGLREWGQYEDLLYFLAYLNGIKTTEITIESNAKKISKQLENDEQLNIVERTSAEFDIDMRDKIKETLESGGAVILSIYHKGSGSVKTHIVTIRNITSKGLELDDPYGQINPEYRRNSGRDAYKDTGGKNFRSTYNWKNVPEYKTGEKDYSKRDFTKTAAENLKENERRGSSSFISWEMIKDSNSTLIVYIEFIQRKK